MEKLEGDQFWREFLTTGLGDSKVQDYVAGHNSPWGSVPTPRDFKGWFWYRVQQWTHLPQYRRRDDKVSGSYGWDNIMGMSKEENLVNADTYGQSPNSRIRSLSSRLPDERLTLPIALYLWRSCQQFLQFSRHLRTTAGSWGGWVDKRQGKSEQMKRLLIGVC